VSNGTTAQGPSDGSDDDTGTAATSAPGHEPSAAPAVSTRPEQRFKNVTFPQAEPPKKQHRAPAPPPRETARPPSPSPGSDAYRRMLVAKYVGGGKRPKGNKERRIALADRFPADPSCLANNCHDGLMDKTVGHYPAKTNRCSACHQQTGGSHPGGGGFTTTHEGAALCRQCHPRFGGKKNTHAPVASGDCLACHDPHSAPNRFLLPVGMERQESLCMKCHDRGIMEQKRLHGPVGLGTCTYCHDPHESDQAPLLKDTPQRLCESCHNAIAQGIKESPYVHSVVTAKGCTSCHDPHGSRYENLLQLEGERFCFSCHEDIQDKYEKSRSTHGAMYLDAQCATCHFPHFSKEPYLLNRREYDLCLNCHSEDNPVRSKAPKNIKRELLKGYIHQPVADGDCSLCHDPHGSKFAKLLVGPYPGSFYAPYTPEKYGLCFNCHDEELLTEAETEATGFRNGRRNLHYVHVAKERKGRTCQACHQAHASDGPKLINQLGATFGAWTMSIEFATTVNGGSCTPGCHRAMEYDREHPVDNSVQEGGYGEPFIDYKSLE